MGVAQLYDYSIVLCNYFYVNRLEFLKWEIFKTNINRRLSRIFLVSKFYGTHIEKYIYFNKQLVQSVATLTGLNIQI
jgi:hypothetical protein